MARRCIPYARGCSPASPSSGPPVAWVHRGWRAWPQRPSRSAMLFAWSLSVSASRISPVVTSPRLGCFSISRGRFHRQGPLPMQPPASAGRPSIVVREDRFLFLPGPVELRPADVFAQGVGDRALDRQTGVDPIGKPHQRALKMAQLLGPIVPVVPTDIRLPRTELLIAELGPNEPEVARAGRLQLYKLGIESPASPAIGAIQPPAPIVIAVEREPFSSPQREADHIVLAQAATDAHVGIRTVGVEILVG